MLVKESTIYVATIGRLLEVAEKGYIDLSKCECLLIDEADKFRLGGGSVWQDLSHVIDSVPKHSFKAVFSATYRPAQVEAFRKMFGEANFLTSGEENQVETALPHIKEVSIRMPE